MDELRSAVGTGSTAMVVSSDPLFRDAATAWLRAEGWEVEASEHDGVRALSVLARRPIDVILVIGDVGQISAASFRSEVRRRWPETPVATVPATDRPGSYDVGFDAQPGEVVHALKAAPRSVPSDVAPPADLAILRLASLTPRERTVLQSLGRGMRPSEIADELGLSRHTVRAHLANLHRKLDIHRRVELIRLAAAAGLLEREGEPRGLSS